MTDYIQVSREDVELLAYVSKQLAERGEYKPLGFNFSDLSNRLSAALAAEVGEVAEWQPIETAPKDGKWLLVWNGLSAQIPAVAYYDGEVWTHGDNTFYWNISHWMPLPAPPSLYIKDTGQ